MDELYHTMQSNVVGISSALFTWDPHYERFKLNGVPIGRKGLLTADALDERNVSKSVSA